ncbi:hypothetical protein CC85DRAFT_66542 [Cutaneotrichosporon oleaginosum]|uniref:Uncharacterized protein n=1 Tax=Cutaneotrichosporon oleaginosum TaxID=879819 RepID=A0A0J0XQ98_9TREE|nr:uncharacterized protein CC85DRAFT_66542 [Cutaneotrichosporon oleaginosum]KLT43252.1 hypothetical protein CC85DRAFT_66542 [Cutaneotrichosporon oleaginosum]TXT09931.1 hypothetical protein COLE_03865 [Cutaneotrichosporon oleaginosum]
MTADVASEYAGTRSLSDQGHCFSCSTVSLAAVTARWPFSTWQCAVFARLPAGLQPAACSLQPAACGLPAASQLVITRLTRRIPIGPTNSAATATLSQPVEGCTGGCAWHGHVPLRPGSWQLPAPSLPAARLTLDVMQQFPAAPRLGQLRRQQAAATESARRRCCAQCHQFSSSPASRDRRN